MWLFCVVWATVSGAWAADPPTRGLEGGAFADPVAGEESIGITRYRAVLFAAQDYPEGSGLPSLQTPGNDTEQLATVLKDQYGFEVEIVRNPTRADIIDHLAVLRDAKPDEAYVVYYAGHGERDADQDRTWWIPVDATKGSSANWVSNDDVAGPIRASQARHILLVSDSCFSGGLLRGVEDEAITPQTAREAATLASRVSRWAITSGGDEPVSDGGYDGMSVFAFHLRRTLRDAAAPYVTVDGIFPELRQAVIRDSEQMPESGAIGKGFHQGGQLVFANRSADPEAAKAAAAVAPPRRDCTVAALQDAIRSTEVAYRAIRDARGPRPAPHDDPALAPFAGAVGRMEERLRCVIAPIDPSTVATIHRLKVLDAILTGDDVRGVAGARAMLGADPNAGWSVVLGASPPEWTAWTTRALADGEGGTRRVRPPLGGWLLVDGAQVGAWRKDLPTDRPYVFQYQRDSEAIGKSLYVDAGDPVPSYPKLAKSQFRTIGVTLLLVGATGALTSLPIPWAEVTGGTSPATEIDKSDPLRALWRRNLVGFVIGTSATGAGIGFMIASVGAR